MNDHPSPVVDYLDNNRRSREFIGDVLCNRRASPSGDELVDEHLNPMVSSLFETIRAAVAPNDLTRKQCLLFIEELSVFARYNAQFLRHAADSVEGAVPELAQEFRRNALEEGGERGKLPAHYVLYTSALLSDLDILVNGHFPRTSTQTLVLLHDVIVDSHSPSTICGAYYATEGVAIDETVLLRDITSRLAELEMGKTVDDLPALRFYYDLHLDASGSDPSEHHAGVEIEHQEGIAHFIREHARYNLDLAQICDGFLQILNGMAAWWLDLAGVSQDLIRE